ncbi:hypothetical protein N474_14975 [Pseudoalteromonas luteoviolacea CPMOR-2]|uniref:DUF4234 domain-containing protein n=1 Tax=Pseudoalteromonas luteoviolacea DSM 6061 TaxID=1365250 RepID=A0A161ZZ57_9GAMM|nr:hypothetical protein [Pseudoalteromonas luteoviolacea]KZN39741.1 hypothetical protein N475_13355 [Pseudoalteromonas luteoviolacea DSM 6061]KZN55286.1 hypothetical protein N474_14975 [Pseudoalteromonas luteoviolacea CPMOR-2]MBE0385676.1 hypothetical protein [Pseudoalteromonas luteoviolacea DSM 6061]
MTEEVLPKSITDELAEMQFYIVSPRKFWTLNIMTFGFYSVYWFFKHWQEYKKSTGEDLWPIARGIFSIFFAHSLFSLMETKYEIQHKAKPSRIFHYATLFVVASILGNIGSRLADNEIGLPYTMYSMYITLIISSFCLHKAQSLINLASADPNGNKNDRFTLLNFVWIFIGLVFWIFLIIGTFAITAQ